ncbi:secretin N-terminal domain-containing protein [uncultured Fusobacterium sp.]|jgi:general secretion pathway protein D|uniref:secretin N-terminal domain-containing protein n=1 Tax=uncultured Fusobacterium sp. TaxID=159267 RepID=UPI0025E0AB25|nr:secretin N-terminal domain-containing protein [uncultured Fusobacterium sp.]
MKKYLILLLIFFICYNSNGETGKNNLTLIKIEQDLELKDMILSDVVAILSKESGKSIVVDDKSKDIKLDMFFSKGENLKDILESICMTNDLKLKEMANIIVLTKNKTGDLGEFSLAGQVLDEEENQGLENVKITIKDMAMDSVKTIYDGNFIINNLKPGIYMVKFEKAGYESTSKIIKLVENLSTIEIRMRKNRSSKIYQNSNLQEEERGYKEFCSKKIKLKNINSKEIQEILNKIYGDIIDIAVLEKNNSIVITGNEKIIIEVEDFIKDIDRDIKQVRITSQIFDVTENLFEELGFDWLYSSSGSIDKSSGTDIGILGNSSVEGAGNVLSSGISLIRQFNSGSDILGMGLNLLQSTQDLVITAMPSIVVTDGAEGEFKITEEVIVGEEKQENDNTEKTTYTPIFKEAGIILKVTPTIGENDTVFLKVKIEVSNFKLKKIKNENITEDTGTYNSNGGSKIGRSIETTVKMRNGETIFIGGLKRSAAYDINSQVPILGDVPVLGVFFKNKEIKKEKTDIYVRLKVDIEGEEKEEEFNKINKQVEELENRKVYPAF